MFDTEEGEYVVKARNNRQQSIQVLANELAGGLCLDYLDVRHPEPAVVQIPQAIIDDNPSAKYTDNVSLESGGAFGSKHWQSDPLAAIASTLVVNRQNVGGTLAYDTWVRNHDRRQYRVRASEEEPGKYEAIPVDQGHSLGNPNWTPESLAADRQNVSVANSPIPVARDHLSHAIERLRHFDRAQAEHIVSQVPTDWLSPAERAALIDYLVERAPRAADALEAAYPVQGG